MASFRGTGRGVVTKWSLEVIICDLVLAVAINTSAMLLSFTPISFSTWYPGTASAFFTNVLLQLVLPVPSIGAILSKPLEGKGARWLLSVFVENLVFVTFISLTMAFVQHGTRPVFDIWLTTYPYLVLVGYAVSLVLYVLGRRKRASSAQ